MIVCVNKNVWRVGIVPNISFTEKIDLCRVGIIIYHASYAVFAVDRIICSGSYCGRTLRDKISLRILVEIGLSLRADKYPRESSFPAPNPAHPVNVQE